VASGECVVERVVLASEAFGPDVHPDVPDVMVVFRTDLGILEHVRSDRTGEFQVSNEVPGCPRSGDHGIESRLWASGPGIEPGISDATGNVLDLAPSVLQRLGLTPPRGLDGRPLFT
jgi:predicted AlkP superfamily phosphohydrolase/phosphomutase